MQRSSRLNARRRPAAKGGLRLALFGLTLMAAAPTFAAVPEPLGLPQVAAFREAPAPSATHSSPLADDRWWSIFADPILDGLIARVRRQNVSLQEAGARLAQARSHLVAAEAARRPRVSLSVSGVDDSGPLVNAAGTSGGLIDASIHLAYEVDIFGRLAKARAAAGADVQASEALLRDTRLTAEADTARAYLSIRLLDEERALLGATADTARATLQIAQGRRQRGLDNEVTVLRAQAELGALESEALALDRTRAEFEHALGFLIGEPTLAVAPVESRLSAAPPSIPPNLPSSVLARRPDVAAAERAVIANQARLKIARTAWLPNLSLTASDGYASPGLASLIRSSVSSFGLDLVMALPPFDGGRRKAGIAGATAELDLAQASYRERVLAAFRDVDDQLSKIRLLAEQSAVLDRSVAADERALQILTSRKANGLASELELLEARRTDLRDRRTAVQIQSARYLATIGLVRAMGGGWNEPAVTSTP